MGRPRARGRLPDQHRRRGLQGERYPPSRPPFPHKAEGYPILVELEGIDRLFDPDGALPEVRGFWTADAVGKDGEMAGVRDLALLKTGEGEELHLVTGNVDSRDKQSVLIQDYPGGRETVATHSAAYFPRTPTLAPRTESSGVP